jgi:hypothetical protein
MNGLKVTHYRHFWQALVVLIADAAFFTRTDASKIAPFLLIVGILLLAVTFYELIYGLLSFARLYGLPIRHKNRLAIYLSGILVLIVALQSIGELTPRDILVLLPLATIGYIYGLYTSTRRRNLDG